MFNGEFRGLVTKHLQIIALLEEAYSSITNDNTCFVQKCCSSKSVVLQVPRFVFF